MEYLAGSDQIFKSDANLFSVVVFALDTYLWLSN